MKTWGDVKYFRPDEFASPDAPGSGIHMDLAFVLLLDQIRERLGVPLKIHSGYRSAQYNAALKESVEKSAHTLGWAADIETLDSRMRFRIIRAAIAVGITRIGIGKTFVHLDVDPTKDKDVQWLYS